MGLDNLISLTYVNHLHQPSSLFSLTLWLWCRTWPGLACCLGLAADVPSAFFPFKLFLRNATLQGISEAFVTETKYRSCLTKPGANPTRSVFYLKKIRLKSYPRHVSFLPSRCCSLSNKRLFAQRPSRWCLGKSLAAKYPNKILFYAFNLNVGPNNHSEKSSIKKVF